MSSTAGSASARQYFLQSERLGFSHWQESDGMLAANLWGDPRVTRFIDARGRLSPADIEQRLEREIHNQRTAGVQYWPIFSLREHQHVGCCGLRTYGSSPKVYEIGFHVCSTHWRNGYAFEAAQAVVRYARQTLEASYLFAGHNPNNAASRCLLQKLGFRYTHDEFYEPTGLDHLCYRLDFSQR